jgi:hypothetical protein
MTRDFLPMASGNFLRGIPNQIERVWYQFFRLVADRIVSTQRFTSLKVGDFTTGATDWVRVEGWAEDQASPWFSHGTGVVTAPDDGVLEIGATVIIQSAVAGSVVGLRAVNATEQVAFPDRLEQGAVTGAFALTRSWVVPVVGGDEIEIQVLTGSASSVVLAERDTIERSCVWAAMRPSGGV